MMDQFEVIFKRTESFYKRITIEASNIEEAREKAEELSCNGGIEFDYFSESDILDEYILNVEKR